MAIDFAADRRGVALPLTMLALAVIGLLVASIFLLARLEQRAGRQIAASMASDAAAEAGLARFMAVADSVRIDTLPLGRMTALRTEALGGGVGFIDSIFRLSQERFLALATGLQTDRSAHLIARSTHGRFAVLDGPSFEARAVIASTGPVLFDGGANIDGGDVSASALADTCPVSGPAIPAMADSIGQATFGPGCPSGSCLHGSPSMVTDSALSRSTLERFGTWSLSTLLAAADLRLSGTVTQIGPVVDPGTHACDATLGNNWGEPDDPASPCFAYVPIIALAPGSRVEAGRGQGVLVAEGDLEIGPGFQFAGPMVVAGRLKISGTGVQLSGALRLLHQVTDTAVVSQGAIGFSSCAIRRAEAGHRRLRFLPERSWSVF